MCTASNTDKIAAPPLIELNTKVYSLEEISSKQRQEMNDLKQIIYDRNEQIKKFRKILAQLMAVDAAEALT